MSLSSVSLFFYNEATSLHQPLKRTTVFTQSISLRSLVTSCWVRDTEQVTTCCCSVALLSVRSVRFPACLECLALTGLTPRLPAALWGLLSACRHIPEQDRSRLNLVCVRTRPRLPLSPESSNLWVTWLCRWFDNWFYRYCPDLN